MQKITFDISNLSEYREDNCLEVKKATNGLPHSIWETYSAFANSDGGLIILGVEEDKNHQLHITGVNNPDELVRDFWNTINNPQKISLNILTDKMVSVRTVEDKQIVVIEIPRAEREMRPVYVGTDPVRGTYRRNHEGDFHCTREQVSAFFRDASPVSVDTKVLTEMDYSVFCTDTIKDYRMRFNAMHANHVWSKLDDELFLRRIGAMGLSTEDNKIHPTIAGLLMFGYEYEIVREFSGYFLDYQERLDPTMRWTHRVTSSSGDWSGNLFDFYYRIINRLTSDLPVPFRLDGMTRVDDTKLHEAVREALLNTLVHADYYGRQGTVVIKGLDRMSFANPGDMRISLKTALEGGVSDPRNTTLMKMFGLIGVGERAGSGVPSIVSVWSDATGVVPTYKQSFAPERVQFVIDVNGTIADKPLKSDVAIPLSGELSGKTPEKTSEKMPEKTSEKILYLISDNPRITTRELVDIIGIHERNVARNLKILQERGFLRRIGGRKEGYWQVQTQ
jgi:predicted HTH transcriptional regulator